MHGHEFWPQSYRQAVNNSSCSDRIVLLLRQYAVTRDPRLQGKSCLVSLLPVGQSPRDFDCILLYFSRSVQQACDPMFSVCQHGEGHTCARGTSPLFPPLQLLRLEGLVSTIAAVVKPHGGGAGIFRFWVPHLTIQNHSKIRCVLFAALWLINCLPPAKETGSIYELCNTTYLNELSTPAACTVRCDNCCGPDHLW